MRIRGRERVSTPVSDWLPTNTFLPATLKPELWFDAADSQSILASSGAVFQWSDKSGNSRHVFQSVSASRPTTGTNSLNGLNVFNFDGGDWLSSGATLPFSNSTNFNVFAVATLAVENTFSSVFSTGTPGGTGAAAAFQVGNFTGARRMATDFWAPSGMRGSTTLATATPYILSYAVTPWADMRTVADFRLNGAPETETAYGTSLAATSLTNGAAFIGAFGASLATSRWNGQIAEVIVYDMVMTSAQVESIEQYLSTKWGVALA
jgi:hypothetical protein